MGTTRFDHEKRTEDARSESARIPAIYIGRPEVGACLHANTSGNHRRAVFAAKAAPTKPAGRLRVQRSETHRSPAEASSDNAARGPFVSWEYT